MSYTILSVLCGDAKSRDSETHINLDLKFFKTLHECLQKGLDALNKKRDWDLKLNQINFLTDKGLNAITGSTYRYADGFFGAEEKEGSKAWYLVFFCFKTVTDADLLEESFFRKTELNKNE